MAVVAGILISSMKDLVIVIILRARSKVPPASPCNRVSGFGLKGPIAINPNPIKIKAIDFKLKDLEGNEFSLSNLKGKRVFLDFWATWCPLCKAEMPEIEKLYQETKDSDLIIVAVDIGESLNTIKIFIDSNKDNFKVLLDSDQSVAFVGIKNVL